MKKNSRNKTFPKEGLKKLKEVIQKLKARNSYLEKKIKFYEKEVTDKLFVTTKKDTGKRTKEDVRREVLQRFRDSLKRDNG